MYATIQLWSAWPFGYGHPFRPWIIRAEWEGRPWQLTAIAWELEKDNPDWRSYLPWSLLRVQDVDYTLTILYARRDGLLLFTALTYWLWFNALRPVYYRFAYWCFRVARRFGYGYVPEGVMFQWRDLFRKRP